MKAVLRRLDLSKDLPAWESENLPALMADETRNSLAQMANAVQWRGTHLPKWLMRCNDCPSHYELPRTFGLPLMSGCEGPSKRVA